MWSMQLKAAQYLVMGTAPTPDPAQLSAGTTLVRFAAGGICGSDLPYYRGDPNALAVDGAPTPGFPLHELAGDVVATTDPTLQPGMAVVGWATSQNGLSEYVVTTNDSLWPYDRDAFTPNEAVVMQPLACVMYAVERLGDVDGRRCAVIGQGPIGLLFARVLKERGATVVGIDRIDRQDFAHLSRADEIVSASAKRWVHGLNQCDRPDVIVEAVGHQTQTLDVAVTAAAMGGRIFYFGIPDESFYSLNMELMLQKDLCLMSGLTRERQRVLAEAGDFLRRNTQFASDYVTQLFSVAEANDAFRAASVPKEGQMKIVIVD